MELVIRDWLAPLTAILRDAAWSMPLMQAIHLLGVSLLLGSAVLLYPRLIRAQAYADNVSADILRVRLLPWMWGALAVMVVTGAVLFAAEPVRMMRSPFFRAKLVMVLVALLMLFVLERRMRSPRALSEVLGSPAALKWVASFSIALWITIAITGRLIGYGRRLISHFFD